MPQNHPRAASDSDSNRRSGFAPAALALMAVLTLSVATMAVMLRGTRSSAQTALTEPRVITSPPVHRWTGVSSCAAYACHGGDGPLGDDRSAYRIWMASDLHSQAGAVLREPASRELAARLAQSGSKSVAPDADPRCLACHVSTDVDRLEPSHSDIRDGVSCERCHGPASDWLEAHTSPSWKQLSDEEKRQRGMLTMNSAAERVRNCVPCHVGAPGHDVNHDLIAAGHPRLNFEYTSSFEAMPRHWTEPNANKQETADADVRAWAYGQVIAAKASLDVLADRARAAVTNQALRRASSWPEFAEYDCDSCHHDLSEPSRSSKRGPSNRPPGSLLWGDWYLPLASSLAGQAAKTGSYSGGPALEELHRLMTTPEPDPRSVERLAAPAAAQLGGWFAKGLAGIEGTADELGRLLRSSLATERSLGGASRDRIEQLSTAVEIFARARERNGRPLEPALLSKLRDAHSRLDAMEQPGDAVRQRNALMMQILERANAADVTPGNQSPK